MDITSKIFIAGSKGLVGSALVRALKGAGYDNLLTPEIDQLDLTCQSAVASFFQEQSPEYVILAAAKVGGILANNSYPAEFIHINLVIQNNVIHSAWKSGVKRLLFLGSSCIYPRLASQPMKEDSLLTGTLEPTNEPYAIAKIAGIKMCEAYNRQYGTEFIAVMPTNLYGPGDNFHPDESHVLPALIRRFHEAKMAAAAEVVVWGSGKPRRELLYVDDMAAGSLYLMNLPGSQLRPELLSYPKPCFLNLGTGVDASIAEIAGIVKSVIGFEGKIVFDSSKPDGTPQKLQDVSRSRALGWSAKVLLHEGVEKTYAWFLDNIDRFRK
ncbi:MAG: GDP-L-fucose synthase [Geobacteraceae bacterium]|nr:GDP-L-fucose synthase [Geobacteraceae bacterium]